ncbi:MAG TPA: acetyl-CoA decarbonylase/synthase complex subunit delta [Desulfobacterales bacterium]|nr:acetyl-CoA decarbonylase/synthase complex subunit delta [Desulfobacterales bacterium]
MGNDGNEKLVGGSASMPFQLFEGDHPNQPLIAMEVADVKPEEWPETLSQHFSDVYDNPVAWAEKCVKVFGAEAIAITLGSTDPNGMNRSAADAAKTAADVIAAVDVPVIVWGCGNADKDTETLRDITSVIGDKKVCLSPLEDSNYRTIGATAMAFQHPIVAASPIDVNLAKQLNILLENLGVSLDSVLMDPSVGALGYGIEYTYSVMERIRIAALTQQDEKLQVPIICNLGCEVWKAKETKLPSDDMIGDQETRGIMMEAITASCMLMAGGEVMIMRHPKAIALTKAMVAGLME